MANRNTLHINKFEGFKHYLYENDIPYRKGKGDYQVLQVMTEKHGFQCIYRRADMPEHFTVQDKLYPLVRKFLNESTPKKSRV